MNIMSSLGGTNPAWPEKHPQNKRLRNEWFTAAPVAISSHAAVTAAAFSPSRSLRPLLLFHNRAALHQRFTTERRLHEKRTASWSLLWAIWGRWVEAAWVGFASREMGKVEKELLQVLRRLEGGGGAESRHNMWSEKRKREEQRIAEFTNSLLCVCDAVGRVQRLKCTYFISSSVLPLLPLNPAIHIAIHFSLLSCRFVRVCICV